MVNQINKNVKHMVDKIISKQNVSTKTTAVIYVI